jgi:hypothetical protein
MFIDIHIFSIRRHINRNAVRDTSRLDRIPSRNDELFRSMNCPGFLPEELKGAHVGVLSKQFTLDQVREHVRKLLA